MKVLGFISIFALAVGLTAGALHAEEIVVEMHYVTDQGVGQKIGTVTVSDNPHGTLFTPQLNGLSPGLRGFHIHEFGDCAPAEKDGKMVAGQAAGGHFDPSGSGRHEGPYSDGHLGDLPALYVDQEGRAEHPVLAPRIKLEEIRGRALMIHSGGDNYSDEPKELGGGGSRVACGLIK